MAEIVIRNYYSIVLWLNEKQNEVNYKLVVSTSGMLKSV